MMKCEVDLVTMISADNEDEAWRLAESAVLVFTNKGVVYELPVEVTSAMEVVND